MAGAQGRGAEPNQGPWRGARRSDGGALDLATGIGGTTASASGAATKRQRRRFPNRPPFLTVYRPTRPCPTEPHGLPVQLQAGVPNRANRTAEQPILSCNFKIRSSNLYLFACLRYLVLHIYIWCPRYSVFSPYTRYNSAIDCIYN